MQSRVGCASFVWTITTRGDGLPVAARLNGLIRSVANWFQQTFRTLRIPRHTERSPVMDHLMREQNPALLRNHADQVLLDLDWIFLLRQIEAARDALYVRVHHDAGRD